MDLLRNSVKPNRIYRIEDVLRHVSRAYGQQAKAGKLEITYYGLML
jgi:hypothetical protein